MCFGFDRSRRIVFVLLSFQNVLFRSLFRTRNRTARLNLEGPSDHSSVCFFSKTYAVSRRIKRTFLALCRMLPAYYMLNDEEKDYICSQNDANGMHSCFDLPPTRAADSLICNATANTALFNGSCVNWNHYYTECKSQGENPFQGTISFDNIGLAWVAIFVVSITCLYFPAR